MIVPSIDLERGRCVQLVSGEELAIDAGDPMPVAERFSVAGEIAVIDLDAAKGTGTNQALVECLVDRFDCRVGGGIRDAATARMWLDRGAAKVVIGTAATPEVLGSLPRDRVVAALDTKHGEVVVEGWRAGTGQTLGPRIEALKPFVGGFLVTVVEREGRMEGIDLSFVREVVEMADPVRVTVAGGVTTPEEVAAIDRLGADCQVGMALYTGRLGLADAVAAPLVSDREDGLWPTVVCDERGVALGLAYSNAESLRSAVERRQGVYWSRRRGLWAKGETSGDKQELLRIDLDCDRDALRFVVRQRGRGFCHLGLTTCWGPGGGLASLERTLQARRGQPVPGSYTNRLMDEPELLAAKLTEEARELAEATEGPHVAEEAADLAYFASVKLARHGLGWAEVERVLERRARRATRRPGDAKP
ncbi:MAG: phosphoribosyl-ATP diphosphatase [Fimbriimonadaceae bacterium]|nr:phosphoribosyl-ATP diphosphatase [Fimbriimonadaceae bacterium]QYK59156.1 MAG: phosphoribosyl-ATP diphosphatase [Fimbriimonadaceae bacterium]